MQFKVIAADLDGTLAMDDHVRDSTWKVLQKAKRQGISIFLVTGRNLRDLENFPSFEEVCEVIIAENGAAIYYTSTGSVVLPFGHLAPEVISKLKEEKIPFVSGLAIAATHKAHDQKVLEILTETRYAATIEYNKGAVMLLPPGASKGTGLMVALQELGYSHHNVVAMGDAENDRSLFELAELSVAVSNATANIKAIADYHLSKPNGEGVTEFISDLIKGIIPQSFRPRPDRQLILGDFTGPPVVLNPLHLTTGNLGIFGSSGSGKSWLAGMVAEKLLHLDYQICIIDPEGDYRGLKAFPNTLLLGSTIEHPPRGTEISTLLEYSGLNLVFDLSMYTIDQKISYLSDLIMTISNLRETRGNPHWILIDEIHYFAQDPNHPLTLLLADRMQKGGYALVSYKPNLVASSIIDQLDYFFLTNFDNLEEIEGIPSLLSKEEKADEIKTKIQQLHDKQALFFCKQEIDNQTDQPRLIEFTQSKRKVPHIRHLHKYLRAPLPLEKQFHFDPNMTKGKPFSAASIYDFLKLIPQVPIDALIYHLQRGDFEAWSKDVLHDSELVKRFRKIANRNLAHSEIRATLQEAVSTRYQELERLI